MINICQLLFHTDLEVLQMEGKFDLMNLVANLSFVKEKLEFLVRFKLINTKTTDLCIYFVKE